MNPVLAPDLGSILVNKVVFPGLVRPNEVIMDELEAEYRAPAEDSVAEQEALDWLEASVDEALD